MPGVHNGCRPNLGQLGRRWRFVHRSGCLWGRVKQSSNVSAGQQVAEKS